MILQCTRCLSVTTWDGKPPGPGLCVRRHRSTWRVLKDYPPRGFVRVISSQGSQELQAPLYREDPTAWK
jgi:hypothetical protein